MVGDVGEFVSSSKGLRSSGLAWSSGLGFSHVWICCQEAREFAERELRISERVVTPGKVLVALGSMKIA